MKSDPEIAQYLTALPCLAVLGREDLVELMKMIHIRRVDKNHVVYEEADHAGFLYIVKSGAIKLFRASQEGRELFIKKIGPGECVCCAPLFGSRQYKVSAAATEDTFLMVVPAEKFREILFRKQRETSLVIISCLSRRIEHLSMLLSELTFSDVEERIIMTLLRLAEEKSPDDFRPRLTLTHSDIASMTGTVREVVSRTMSKLKKEGIIVESTVRGFRIDKSRLTKIAHIR